MKRLYPTPEKARFPKGCYVIKPNNAWTSAWRTAPLSAELDKLASMGEESNAAIRIRRKDRDPESFRLVVDAGGVDIEAGDPSGALYASHVLAQLYDARTRTIPFCEIEDRPKLALRGVMIDISRNKIPKLQTLLDLLPILARFRINHLQLYVEGFAMESRTFPFVHLAYEPFQIADYQILEEAADAYGIELVGNQNSFGHLTEWLKRPEFHLLAECPDGFVQWGYPFPASTINPTDPQSLAFVKRLLDGFVPFTRSKWFNLNGDEPFELGRGKSREAVAKKGIGAVYWEFVSQLIDHLETHGKQAMLWGDVLIHHPELMDEIPKNAVFLDWGYDRGYPFDAHATLLSNHHVKFVTCPGTSTWNSFAGRHMDMMITTIDAASAAIRHGGLGVMTTDWGDFGHLQYLPASYWGFAALGMAAWSGTTNEGVIREYLDRHVFGGVHGSVASLWYDLANIQKLEPQYVYNGTALFRSIQFVATDPLPLEVKVEVHRQALSQIPIPDASARRIQAKLSSVRRRIRELVGTGEAFEIIRRELLQTVRFLSIALSTNRIVTDPSTATNKSRNATIRKITEAVQEHRALWRMRNMDSTLDQSLLRLTELARILAFGNGNML